MKWFHDLLASLASFGRRPRLLLSAVGGALAVCLCAAAVTPGAPIDALLFRPGQGFERWIENVASGTEIEKALFRGMQLPGGEVLFRRAPNEAVPALTSLQQQQKAAALYSLRALEEEQKLDFTAAEGDWKRWADEADDRVGAHLDLADFYERRLNPQAEVAALEYAGSAPPEVRERWASAAAQRSWKAWGRALKIVDEYALPHSESARIYVEWIKRYPQESTVYARQFAFLLAEKDFPGATAAIERYRSAFPQDRVFPVKAEADLAVRRGEPKDGLAVYDARFEPLWPADLIKSYFSLVLESHNQRAFGNAIRGRLAADPDDLKNAARLFYLEQQQGQLDSAKAVLAHYREGKEARGAQWSAEELSTLEELFESVQDFREAARYAYALASDHSSPGSEHRGVVALARILLTAPEQPLRVGAGNLALYKNIATMDRGPGYLNGILSLFLNSASPSSEYASEDQLAGPYFHRARAAELLKQIDQRFPDEPARAQLHASLMEAYAVYGEDQSVIREGTDILAQYPKFSGRVPVALGLADAYERTHQVDKEFALYQDLLKELSAKADGVPLGITSDLYTKPVDGELSPVVVAASNGGGESASSENGNAPATQPAGVRSVQYNEVLNRYLARLVALQRLPDALQVLRGELDRNPQDPGLYDKLASFLEQNKLDAHEEEVFERATQQFQETGWYAKLARFYVRQRRNVDYSALMHKVAGIFSGTDLEQFLAQAPAPDQSLGLEVSLYAHQRFPHDLRFVEQLLSEYRRTHNDAAIEKLLWEHWWESPGLRDQLFEVLSRSHRLDAEVAVLRQQSPEIGKGDWSALASRNPAAELLWLEACVWQSHYEQGVGAADALAAAYPADAGVGEQASSLYRSLAYFHPEDTDKAVAIEKRLLDAEPGNLDTLARIGDIYAERERYAAAEPYWIRMAEVHPGESNGYLQSATIFWDYFDFASAQTQLEKGRARLHQPAVFGYEEGAIAESRSDLPGAVRAYLVSTTAGQAADQGSIEASTAESRDRLLALARRSALRAVVEKGTEGLLKQAFPSANAIQLRAGILEAQHRKQDLAAELLNLVARTGSFDVLDAITSTARSHALSEVEEADLRRQIVLTTDPVRSLQLRYQLVDLLQPRDASTAAREIDAIYHEQGKILGVVRATVDYDWDHGRKEQAVSVLMESAEASYPDLRSRFELEAARKLTDLGDYARSRTVLTGLLTNKPLEAGYVAAMADNLARAQDAAGLESFYRSQLELVRKSSLNHDEKQQRIGQLRRGMISTATQLSSFNDAVDQYIELINAYPDDAGLTQEAALYAVAHGGHDQLFGFYQKTANDAPRDPRWSIVLARLGTATEEDALAIDAYGKALKLRPERQDLYIAQASLDERLHRFDDAITLYRRLYLLSYRDPKWMEKVAELSARQGRGADAVKALETGWIDGRPVKASNSFAVAQRLELWGLLDEAQRFAEQGCDQAGADLLVSEQSGAVTYARILARKRQASAALTRLTAARETAPKLTLATVAQQVVKEGPAAVTNDEWRKQREEQRRTQVSSGFAQAVNALGSAVGEFYTPEERSAFAAILKQQAGNASAADLGSIYIPAARSAGLAELTADMDWRLAQLNQAKGRFVYASWLQYQRRRVMLTTSAAQLEKVAPSLRRKEQAGLWQQLADIYRDVGDTAGELRAMEHVVAAKHLEGAELDRFYRLLLAQRPEELAKLAATEDAAAQYLVRNGSSVQALHGIAARGSSRAPVWKDAYTALTGLYLRENEPEVNTATKAAFVHALDADATIGERVAHPVDRNQHLAGEVWFYYGARFGEYLDDEKDARAAEFLESELEHTPGSAGAYRQLAEHSSSVQRIDAALADYRHSLDLNPDQPAVLDCIAKLEWDEGHQAEALAAWSDAVKALAAEMDARHVPESFWRDFESVLDSIVAHHQYESVRQPVDAMLRIYIARNGEYMTESLLRAGYHANGNSVDWLLTITSAALDQRQVLSSILPNEWNSQGKWLEGPQIIRIYRRIVELAQRSAPAGSDQPDYAFDSARQGYLRALLKEKQIAEASALISGIPASKRYGSEWLPLALAVADADGSLRRLLSTWQRQPGNAPTDAPSDEPLRSASTQLPASSARAVQRFIYQRALDRRDLSAANFLGLAAIDLEENNTAGAVQLLRRLTLVSDSYLSDADAAAKLLEEHHKPAEAMEFLKSLTDASPWEVGYKVRLAKAMMAADPRLIDPHSADALALLTAAADDAKAAYSVRLSAAEALKGHSAPKSGSDELVLLAQAGCPSVESASKPLFVAARVAAASCAQEASAKERLLHEALEAAPEDVSVRRAYIFAGFDANLDSRAMIAAENYLETAYYSPNYANVGAENGSDGNGGDGNAGSQEEGNYAATDRGSQAESLSALPSAQAARLIRLAAATYERRRDYKSALQLLSRTRSEMSSDDRKALEEKKQQIELLQARVQANDARAPDIHPELDQGHIVQPRLLLGMPVPARPKSSDAGEEQ